MEKKLNTAKLLPYKTIKLFKAWIILLLNKQEKSNLNEWERQKRLFTKVSVRAEAESISVTQTGHCRL